MVKITAIFLALTLICGCSESSASTMISPEYEPTINRIDGSQSSWYRLNQYFSGIPKYSGVFGTYTAKHLPVAVKCDLGRWATYSNNRDGNLSIYVVNLETQESNLVHVEHGTIDTHQNAAIQCGGGKLWLTVSARGMKRKGTSYSSLDGANWDKLSQSYWSYPQLHWVNGSLLTLYTKYESDPTQSNGVSRKIYSSCNGKAIVDDDIQHYMLSFADKGRVHVVYNDLIGGADFRTNLNYKYSDDGGCTWSKQVRWHEGDFVYLKDFRVSGGKPYALVVISNSADPTKGSREVVMISAERHWYRGKTNHNYTTGSMTSNGDLVFPDGGDSVYAGGSLLDSNHVNYVRRIYGTSNEFVASEGVSSEFESDAWLVWIK